MPTAMAQYSSEQRPADEHRWDVLCDPQTVELVSRDAENVVIGDVIGFSDDQILTVRIVQRLKRGTFWDVGATGSIVVYKNALRLIASGFNPGERLILLFGYRSRAYGHPPSRELELEVCGALPVTKSNLAVVQNGISKDDRPEEIPWY